MGPSGTEWCKNGPYNGKPLGKTCPRVHVARLDGIRLLRVAILSSRFSRRVFQGLNDCHTVVYIQAESVKYS